MTTIAEARAALEAAAVTVAGVKVYELGENLDDPPGFVVGPPVLTPEAHCFSPTNATFSAFLVVALDETALDRLYALTPLVWAAIENHTEGSVTAANPGTYTAAGSGELPCYELVVEHPIGD